MKKLLLGVCGSIAAYKSPDIVRGFRKEGWEIKVVMTEAAARFITPLTLETVTGNPVYMDLFERGAWEISHIALSEFPSVVVVAPASASIIGKIASAICDDLLSCVILATRAPVVFAPAMNDNMWNHRIVQQNVKKLKDLGYSFVGPEKGELASGKIGVGRLARTDAIIRVVQEVHCHG